MKNRSHRLPTSDPPDDWVDGSWTVDCVCGVNFDDGEEMVNCDECGVWVHTRCSRYVKSEKSFACDKCKSKNARNDSEETEVAQLLVELPTKTLKMDNPYQPGGGPPRRPFRLWTDIPIEERVHVQGIPGGEPALFGGLSSVFTPELWKCTGYVPKKFNFQYREFPCWDKEQAVNAKSEGGNENPDDKGAGVLFSLSKESAHSTPVTTVCGMKRQLEDGGCDNMAPSKDMKNQEGENIDAMCAQNGDKKDRTLLRPFVIHTGKRKKEESGATRDQSGKKKVRVIDREGDPKKRAPHACKTAPTLSSDAKQLEFCEDGGPKIVKVDTQNINNKDLSDTLLKYPILGGHHVVENNVDMPKENLASSECLSEAKASEVSRHNCSIGASAVEVKGSHHVPARTGNSPNTDVGMASLLDHSNLGSVPIKEEVAAIVLDNVNNNGGGSSTSAGVDCRKSEPRVEDSITVVANVKDDRSCQDDPNIAVCPSSLELGAKVKKEADTDNSGGTFNVESSTHNIVKLEGAKPLTQHSGASAFHLSANAKMTDTVVTSPQSSDLKVLGVDRSTGVISNCQTDMSNELSNVPCQPKQVEGSDDSNAVGKSSPELKHESRASEEQSKLSSIVVTPAPPCQHKMAASSSASSAIVPSKPSISDKLKPSNLQNYNPIVKRGMSDFRFAAKKDNNSTKTVRCEDRHEMARKILKESSKSSVSSVLKASRSSKSSHTSDYKKTMSDSKDSVLYPSSKSPSASSAQNIGVTSGSSDLASSTHTQIASHVHNKISAPGLPQRGEKVNLSNSQSSTKVNHTAPMHPPAPSNLPAILSDEELALLLHQELNSSPRVPRVPRMRHTGSLPQLGSPTATSMLIKRTSSSGGRDHSAVLRRKNKDLPKHGSRSSREIDDEAQMDRLPTSPDCRRHNSASTGDAFTKREADSGSGKGVQAVKKCTPSVSTTATTLSTGPYSSTEATEQNLSSMRNSPRNASDDDTGTIRSPIHRTLPGLIAEIMSKGKRMTYEELCNAVLPHWPNLRKHNGERYAYSSHSQAVLDCLRNRHEWAQLVDRGPKTNAGRKRRKPDTEAPSFESEDSEYGKDTTTKEVESKSFETHREEFPKGKRKARKRRRLALQGRGIKDVRRRRRADVVSDDEDDDGSFSSSSEESMFSDDEIQGGGTCSIGSEASTSSDEMGTMS